MPFEFILGAKVGMTYPKMYAVMLNPGSYRVELVKNISEPEFTAFQYTQQAADGKTYTTEMYAMHHAHDDPAHLISNKFGGNRASTADGALAVYNPQHHPPVVIDGKFPVPVMFYIGDTDDRTNTGGLTVRVVRA